jgi:hypothetical protein
MMLDGAEECQLSGPIGELVPFSSRNRRSGASSTRSESRIGVPICARRHLFKKPPRRSDRVMASRGPTG